MILDWFPLMRDCIFYLISIVLLALFMGWVTKNEINYWESMILLLIYTLYVIFMIFNNSIKKIFTTKKSSTKTVKNHIELVRHNSFSNSVTQQNTQDVKESEIPNQVENKEEAETENYICFPINGNLFDKVMFIISYPISISLYLTVCNVNNEIKKKYWLLSFIVCLLWLGIYSYCLIWWSVAICDAWNISDDIMGILFLSCGTSIPELLSSIACMYLYIYMS